MLTCLDLFSGIGGFALGFERAGIKTTAFCECDPYARKVLAKHWPDIPIHEDVRSLNGTPGQFDIICGGFPCQDISFAGAGAGLAGERSGLWWDFHRLINQIRPAWVVAENVAALRSRGLDHVLGSLAEIGYDAEWHCVPAGAVGAPHRRDRVWIVAYPHGSWEQQPGDGCDVAHPGCAGRQRREDEHFSGSSRPSPDTGEDGQLGDVAHPHRTGLEALLQGNARELAASLGASPWASEPYVGRVAHGVPKRVDRLKCLGNAVVPPIPEIIGRAILGGHRAPS